MNKKTGLILEGGAMRGMFTAGVTDVLMENGVVFDGAVGVSAGAVFGCNIKSHQIGRALRYNKNYCRNKEYVSFWSLIKTGDLYGKEFAYYRIPKELDPFDTVTFAGSPMEFYVVCTDMKTGRAVYHKCKTGDDGDVEWMRASASMPLASKPVVIGDRYLSDGGTADSIPVRFFESIGYNRNVAVLTQPDGFVKKKNPMLPVMKVVLRKYPRLVHALETRHLRYNETLSYIKQQEEQGKLFVIRPPKALEIGHIEKNPDELERVYQIGRATAERILPQLLEFMNK